MFQNVARNYQNVARVGNDSTGHERELFDRCVFVLEVGGLLKKESPQDIVVVVVPSHDKHNVILPRALMAEWIQNGMQLLADLYGGATAYETFAGIFKTDDGHYLRDKPVLLESFATIDAIQDPGNLEFLVSFAKRMGKTLDQDTIMLVFGTVSYYINDYGGV